MKHVTSIVQKLLLVCAFLAVTIQGKRIQRKADGKREQSELNGKENTVKDHPWKALVPLLLAFTQSEAFTLGSRAPHTGLASHAQGMDKGISRGAEPEMIVPGSKVSVLQPESRWFKEVGTVADVEYPFGHSQYPVEVRAPSGIIEKFAPELPTAPRPPRSGVVRMSSGGDNRVAEMAGQVTAAPQPSAELGHDPREREPQLTEEKLVQLAEASKAVNPATASTSAAVTPVLTLEDFEAALAHSASRGRLTVFKFYAPWCRTCISIKKNYDALADGVMPHKMPHTSWRMRYRMQAAANFAEVADFHEIEYTAARPLCAMCNITSMPLVHVYGPTGPGLPNGELHLSSKLAKSSFISFCNRLAEAVDEVLLPGGNAPEGESVAVREGTHNVDAPT